MLDFLTKIARQESSEVSQFRTHLKEIHYPPKSLDYNKLPNTDGFWNWPINEAAQEADLRPIGSHLRTVGDLILWLNMAALQWERHSGK